MVEFLQSYWWLIIILVGILIYFIWYYKKYGKEKTLEEFKELAYKLMLAAEKQFSSDTVKINWVAEKLYMLLPDSVKILVTTEDLRKWIHELDDDLIDFMEEHELKV